MKFERGQEYLDQIAELEKQIKRLKHAVKKESYGLTWMEIPEAFEDDVENKLPIIKEVKEKAIINDDDNPTHILIEGDNYHALTCLNYTHKGKIDLIYIDPPYNTGSTERSELFKYKDKRFIKQFPDGTPVPKDHHFRHSYWLSFMSKRLELAKTLLSDSGLIFISIDDAEVSNLNLLCNHIFSDKNFVGLLPTIMNLKGNQDQFGFAGTHEYTIVYAKNIKYAKIGEFFIEGEELLLWDEDEYGYFKKGANLKGTGVNAPRERRPNLYYPIFIKNDNQVYVTSDDRMPEDRQKKGDVAFYPITDGKKMTWRWEKAKVESEPYNIIVKRNSNSSISIYKKQRPKIGNLPTKKPKSLLYKPEYSSGNGTLQLKKILGKKKFDNPKPVELIKDIILLSTSKKAIVLDFFAGSGTTGQALMELNNQNEGNRQFILITNNENKIMDEVCYPRLEKVMNKETYILPLGNSLKYYKTEFVGKHNILNANDQDKIDLAHHAGELLALAENTLYELEDLQNDYYQFFHNNKKYMGVYFREELDRFEEFRVKVFELDNPVAVYVFSWGENEFINQFDDRNDIEVKPIPQPILEVYKTIYNLS